MNVFILDKNIKKCAQYHCDKHVIKMILEYAQILSTVCYLEGIKTFYHPTHVKHPCVIWAGKSIQNWRWLKKLAIALNEEYKYRYQTNKNHESFEVIKELQEPVLPDIGLTEFVQAMPNEYKVCHDPVLAYRRYYVSMKQPFATWKRRKVPKWYKEMLEDTI